MAGFGIAIGTAWGFFTDRDNGIFYEFLTYPMGRGEFLSPLPGLSYFFSRSPSTYVLG